MKKWSFFVYFMIFCSSTIMAMNPIKDENKLVRNTKNLKVRFLTITCYVADCTNPECGKFKIDEAEDNTLLVQNDILRKSPSLQEFVMKNCMR